MISVIIPLYNGEKFINRTIQSVVNQDYDEFEIIIANDCSTDHGVDQISTFSNNPKVTLVNNETNMGLCNNVNHAVDLCKGEYLMVLGQDDMIMPGHIRSMIEKFSSDDIVAVFCDYYLINEEDEIYDVNPHCYHREIEIKDLLKNNAIPSCGLVMRTEVFRKVHGYPVKAEYPQYGEYGLWVKMLMYGRFAFNKNTVSLYRRHKMNISNDFQANNYILEKYCNECRRYILRNYRIGPKYRILLSGYVLVKSIKLVFIK